MKKPSGMFYIIVAFVLVVLFGVAVSATTLICPKFDYHACNNTWYCKATLFSETEDTVPLSYDCSSKLMNKLK